MNSTIKRAQRGDTEAFIRLMESNTPMMKRVAYGYFRNDEDVADAIQDTILSAFQHIQTLKKPEYFRTWLIRILINHCNKIYNTNKAFVSDDVIPETQSQDENVLAFMELICSLPEDSRLIFQLYYGERLTVWDISQVLGVNENTVKSRLMRGRKLLQKSLEET